MINPGYAARFSKAQDITCSGEKPCIGLKLTKSADFTSAEKHWISHGLGEKGQSKIPGIDVLRVGGGLDNHH
jgi:hypothetical protein